MSDNLKNSRLLQIWEWEYEILADDLKIEPTDILMVCNPILELLIQSMHRLEYCQRFSNNQYASEVEFLYENDV